jgi:hypothetical protein
MDRRLMSHRFRMHSNVSLAPKRPMTITEKNNRNYDDAWRNVSFNGEGPEDCEHKHPVTGKCMSHYDYQVWVNRHRK